MNTKAVNKKVIIRPYNKNYWVLLPRGYIKIYSDDTVRRGEMHSVIFHRETHNRKEEWKQRLLHYWGYFFISRAFCKKLGIVKLLYVNSELRQMYFKLCVFFTQSEKFRGQVPEIKVNWWIFIFVVVLKPKKQPPNICHFLTKWITVHSLVI